MNNPLKEKTMRSNKLTAVAVIATLVLAACGSDDASTSDATADTEPPTTEAAA
ncbi:MAG: ABC-type glycerol-3-phosphate transport system substrate-binding protein, partial [Ilumatobacter sp.]